MLIRFSPEQKEELKSQWLSVGVYAIAAALLACFVYIFGLLNRKLVHLPLLSGEIFGLLVAVVSTFYLAWQSRKKDWKISWLIMCIFADVQDLMRWIIWPIVITVLLYLIATSLPSLSSL